MTAIMTICLAPVRAINPRISVGVGVLTTLISGQVVLAYLLPVA